MEKFLNIVQFPPPGESRVVYCGDCVTFTLKLPTKTRGTAWVRTNLGSAAVSRKEIILRVEQDEIKLGGAWVDIEMALESDRVYKSVLPLHQTGFFQAKCFFLPEKVTPLSGRPGTIVFLMWNRRAPAVPILFTTPLFGSSADLNMVKSLPVRPVRVRLNQM